MKCVYRLLSYIVILSIISSNCFAAGEVCLQKEALASRSSIDHNRLLRPLLVIANLFCAQDPTPEHFRKIRAVFADLLNEPNLRNVHIAYRSDNPRECIIYDDAAVIHVCLNLTGPQRRWQEPPFANILHSLTFSSIGLTVNLHPYRGNEESLSAVMEERSIHPVEFTTESGDETYDEDELIDELFAEVVLSTEERDHLEHIIEGIDEDDGEVKRFLRKILLASIDDDHSSTGPDDDSSRGRIDTGPVGTPGSLMILGTIMNLVLLIEQVIPRIKEWVQTIRDYVVICAVFAATCILLWCVMPSQPAAANDMGLHTPVPGVEDVNSGESDGGGVGPDPEKKKKAEQEDDGTGVPRKKRRLPIDLTGVKRPPRPDLFARLFGAESILQYDLSSAARLDSFPDRVDAAGRFMWGNFDRGIFFDFYFGKFATRYTADQYYAVRCLANGGQSLDENSWIGFAGLNTYLQLSVPGTNSNRIANFIVRPFGGIHTQNTEAGRASFPEDFKFHGGAIIIFDWEEYIKPIHIALDLHLPFAYVPVALRDLRNFPFFQREFGLDFMIGPAGDIFDAGLISQTRVDLMPAIMLGDLLTSPDNWLFGVGSEAELLQGLAVENINFTGPLSGISLTEQGYYSLDFDDMLAQRIGLHVDLDRPPIFIHVSAGAVYRLGNYITIAPVTNYGPINGEGAADMFGDFFYIGTVGKRSRLHPYGIVDLLAESRHKRFRAGLSLLWEGPDLLQEQREGFFSTSRCDVVAFMEWRGRQVRDPVSIRVEAWVGDMALGSHPQTTGFRISMGLNPEAGKRHRVHDRRLHGSTSSQEERINMVFSIDGKEKTEECVIIGRDRFNKKQQEDIMDVAHRWMPDTDYRFYEFIKKYVRETRVYVFAGTDVTSENEFYAFRDPETGNLFIDDIVFSHHGDLPRSYCRSIIRGAAEAYFIETGTGWGDLQPRFTSAPDNIGKGVKFSLAEEQIEIELVDEGERQQERCSFNVREIPVEQRRAIRELAQTLNISDQPDWDGFFSEFLKTTEVYVFSGNHKTRAAGAFAHMYLDDERKILFVDEVLFYDYKGYSETFQQWVNQAVHMEIIHEAIHAYLQEVKYPGDNSLHFWMGEFAVLSKHSKIDAELAEKAIAKANEFENYEEKSAYLRHYLARYYLQNEKEMTLEAEDGGIGAQLTLSYSGSLNQRLTYMIRLLMALSRYEIELDGIEVIHALFSDLENHQETLVLRNRLLKLLTREGEVKREGVVALAGKVKQARTIVDLFNSFGVDRDEAITRLTLELAQYDALRRRSAAAMRARPEAVSGGQVMNIAITRENRTSVAETEGEAMTYQIPVTLGDTIGSVQLDTDSVASAPDRVQTTVRVLQRTFSELLSQYEDNIVVSSMFTSIRGEGVNCINLVDDLDSVIACFDPVARVAQLDTDTAELLAEDQAMVLLAMAVFHEWCHMLNDNEEEVLLATLEFISILSDGHRDLLRQALENEYVDGNNYFRRFMEAYNQGAEEQRMAARRIMVEMEIKQIEGQVDRGELSSTELCDMAMGMRDSTSLAEGLVRRGLAVVNKFWSEINPGMSQVTDYLRRAGMYSTVNQLNVCEALNNTAGEVLSGNRKPLRMFYDVNSLLEMDGDGRLRAGIGGWNQFINEMRQYSNLEVVLVSPWDRDVTLRAFYSLYDAEIARESGRDMLVGVSDIISAAALSAQVKHCQDEGILVGGITDERGEGIFTSALEGAALLVAPHGCVSLLSQTAVVHSMAMTDEELTEELILQLPIVAGIMQIYRDLDPTGNVADVFSYRNGILYFNLPPIDANLLEQLNDAVMAQIAEEYA